MDELAQEYPEEAWLQKQNARDHVPQSWHQLYFRAFDALRYDRHYGAMGGEGPIYYTALSRYARDHGIDGDDLKLFLVFMNAIDAEHLAMAAEDDKRRQTEQTTDHGHSKNKNA